MIYHTIVIGGGQAGLATAYWLQKEGLHYTVLNASHEPTGTWPRHYDSLKLFSPAQYSSLPGMPFPAPDAHYPSRDEVVAYLRKYAQDNKLRIQNNRRVTRVSRTEEGHFTVQTEQGDTLRARTVVAASGSFNRPNIPDIEGLSAFQGNQLHSSEYRSPASFAGQRVIVVGAANTAVQIAYELSKVAETSLAIRDKLRWAPQSLFGKDFHFWLEKTGLDRTSWLRDQATPVLDIGHYREAIKEGKIGREPMFTRFTPQGVRWPNGKEEPVDTVIFATGYKPNLAYLHDILGEAGAQDTQGGISHTAPGLYYVGFSGQRSFSSATLRGVGADAKYITSQMKSFLDGSLQTKKARCCNLPLLCPTGS